MTLLDAKPYDARKARIRRNILIGILVAIPIVAALTWYLWDWPEEHRVNRFFHAIEVKDYAQGFALWNNDPHWQQHLDRYKTYPYGQFYQDWGPASDYGTITSHQVVVSKQYGSGVVVGVLINGGKTPLFLWVERSAKTIGFSPVELNY
jgi:hypothetical protein